MCTVVVNKHTRVVCYHKTVDNNIKTHFAYLCLHVFKVLNDSLDIESCSLSIITLVMQCPETCKISTVPIKA